MPRPARTPDGTKSRTIYLSDPEWAALTERAWAAHLSPGAYVAQLLGEPVAAHRRSPAEPDKPKARSKPVDAHAWADNAALGKVCSTCGVPKKVGDGKPCPGSAA